MFPNLMELKKAGEEKYSLYRWQLYHFVRVIYIRD
jgi:hypothetical protein